jgi:hypothetical protein
MRRERTKQTYKLRLLALVLALALLWYSLNPAPSPVSRHKSEEEPPDEKRREMEPQVQGARLMPVVSGTLKLGGDASPPPVEDVDDFEWPEFIDG